MPQAGAVVSYLCVAVPKAGDKDVRPFIPELPPIYPTRGPVAASRRCVGGKRGQRRVGSGDDIQGDSDTYRKGFSCA